MYGYAGTILYINLTTGKIVKKPSAEYVKAFFGGRGVNAKLFFDEAKPNQSWMDPEAPLIFGAGALSGTGVIGTGKMEITSVSPAKTEEWSYGNVGIGSMLASEMKFAGYDNFVIKGKAEKPVYVFINNDDVEIRDAKEVWGKGIFATQDLIREQLDDKEVQVASIGQAGENLVVMATIEHGYRSGTALGAVMGAKKLKTVAVRGTKPIKVYDPEKILEYNEKTIELRSKRPSPQPQGKDPYGWYYLGSDAGIVGNYEGHTWRERPDVVKGFQAGYIGDYFYKRYGGCFGCPYACTPLYSIPEIGTAAYRCYASFWPWQVWQTDMKITFEAQRMMSNYGLESREVAVDVGWLMQLYNEGLITAKDTDGIPFERGSKEAFFSTIHKLAKREGFGDILANGPVPFAKKLGAEAEKRLIHNKGMTMRTFDYRCEPGTTLGEAVAARGNSHRASPYRFVNWEKPTVERGGERFNAEKPEDIMAAKEWAKKMFGTEQAINPFAYEGKPALLIYHQHEHAIMDSTSFCEGMARIGVGYGRGVNLGVSWQFAIDRFVAATGMPMDEKKLYTIAERVINVERACVVRDGRSRATDTVPEFFFKVGIADGPQKGRKLDKTKFKKIQDEYYTLRGWNVETGVPTRVKLEELGLKDIANSLEKLGKLPKPQKPKIAKTKKE